MRFINPSWTGPRMLAAWTLVALAGSGVLATQASAKGGTAKPPQNAVSPIVTPTLPDPAWSVDPAQLRGFDVTGYIQASTVGNDGCPNETDKSRWGGSVTINGTTITVPCNLVVQLPANTLTWADFVGDGTLAPLDLKTGVGSIFPSVGFELHAIGNTVGSKDIAGLIYVSQQSTNGGSGVIKTIDYATGDLTLDNGDRDRRSTTPTAASAARRALTSGSAWTTRTRPSMPRPAIRCASRARTRRRRTIRSARRRTGRTGRRTPAAAGTSPWPVSSRPPAASSPAPPLARCTAPSTSCRRRGGATGPDSRQQAPFEVGDFITFSGHDHGRTAARLREHDRGEPRHLHAARHPARLRGDRRVRCRQRRSERHGGQRGRAGDRRSHLPRGGDHRRQDRRWTST